MRSAKRKSVQAPLNILAVDDEPSVASSLKFVLSDAKRRLTTAGDGDEALERMAEHRPPFDLVITDNNMPRMSGLELVRRLREENFRGKIVVLSAHLSDENRRAYEALHVDEMIPKPFDIGHLRDTIDRLSEAA
jgi:CheY-like chemotaxis protein